MCFSLCVSGGLHAQFGGPCARPNKRRSKSMADEFSPYLVATPLVTLMFAFYGRVMPFGALGYVGGALAGFVWSLVAGVVSSWLSQDATIAALSADAVLFACVIVAGSLVGGGVLYLLL